MTQPSGPWKTTSALRQSGKKWGGEEPVQVEFMLGFSDLRQGGIGCVDTGRAPFGATVPARGPRATMMPADRRGRDALLYRYRAQGGMQFLLARGERAPRADGGRCSGWRARRSRRSADDAVAALVRSRSFSAKPEVTEPLLSLKKKVCHSISLGWREICISHPIQPSPLSRFFLSRERMGRHIIPT